MFRLTELLRTGRYIGKDRRKQADFIGADRVLKELKEGPVRRRVGFEVQGAPAREGAEVYSEDGKTLIGMS